jgi:hypothetical protein
LLFFHIPIKHAGQIHQHSGRASRTAL